MIVSGISKIQIAFDFDSFVIWNNSGHEYIAIPGNFLINDLIWYSNLWLTYVFAKFDNFVP